MQVGYSLFEEDDFPGALTAFQSALGVAATPEVYLWIARSRFQQGGLDAEALEDIGKGLILNPTGLELLYLRVEITSQLERYSLWVEDLETILKISPGELGFRRPLVEYLFYDGDVRGTIRHASHGLAYAENDPALRYYRAASYAESNDLPRARGDYELILEDEEFGPWAVRGLAGIALQQGQAREALRLSRRAIRALPDDAYSYDVKSHALVSLGRLAEAEVAAAQAHDLDPSYGGYRKVDQEFDEIIDAYAMMFTAFCVWCIVMGLFGLLFVSGGKRALLRGKGKGELPSYDGDWKALFQIYLQNVVFTLLTLGIYRFWARVRNRKFHYQHTSFAGGRFDYLATGREKFVGFLKGLLILLPAAVGVIYIDGWITERVGMEVAPTIIGMIVGAFFYFLRPLILVGSSRFNLARTSWNNLRFHFTGRVRDAYELYVRDLILMIFTFGIYYSWHACRVRKFKLEHTNMGDAHFGFNGTGAELFGISFFGMILCYLSLGLYVPWYIAARRRFFVGKTVFRNRRLESRITGRHVLAVGGPAMLLVLLTLGLALPWAVVRWRTLLTHTTRYAAELDPTELESFTSSASSTIEGIGEAGDALSELGDLFGV